MRGEVSISWTASADAKSYNIYRAIGNAPDYELIAADIKGNGFLYKASDLENSKQVTLKVTAVRADDRESFSGATAVWLLP